MQRLRHTSHQNKKRIDIKRTIKNREDEISSHLTIISIDNTEIAEAPQRHSGISTTHMTLVSSLKKSSFYRKFMNHSISQHRCQASTTPHTASTQKQSLFMCNQFNRIPKQNSEGRSINCHSIVDESHKNYTHQTSKQVDVGKIKSFESFLSNKRKQNQKKSLTHFKRTKIIKMLRSQNPVKPRVKENEQTLGLLGTGIKKLSEEKSTERIKPYGGTKCKTNQFLTLDETKSIYLPLKMRNIQSEWQSSKPMSDHTFIKYFFDEDSGYFPFDKVSPISSKRQVNNNKKLIYANLHKQFRRSKLSHQGTTSYTSNNIDGWIVKTEEEQEIYHSVPK